MTVPLILTRSSHGSIESAEDHDGGNLAGTARTRYALKTDARQDKPGGRAVSHQGLEFFAWLGATP